MRVRRAPRTATLRPWRLAIGGTTSRRVDEHARMRVTQSQTIVEKMNSAVVIAALEAVSPMFRRRP